MKNLLKNQHQAGIVMPIVLVLFVASITLAFWKFNQDRKDLKQSSSVTQVADTSSQQLEVEITKIVFVENDYFSLSYPSDLVKLEATSSYLKLKKEGAYLVEIQYSNGGKGGGCLDYDTDTLHNTESCSSLEVLDYEELAYDEDLENDYLAVVGAKYTRPKSSDSEYGIFLTDSNNFADESNRQVIDAVFLLGILNRNSFNGGIENKVIFDSFDTYQSSKAEVIEFLKTLNVK